MSVTGDPTLAVVDAIQAALLADATLTGLVPTIVGKLSQSRRTAVPYLVLGRRHHANDAGAMQKDGGHVSLQIDGWHTTPALMHQVHSRCYVLLQRTDLAVAGFTLIGGSLTREFASVEEDPDEDTPGEKLFQGVQLWGCEVHES